MKKTILLVLGSLLIHSLPCNAAMNKEISPTVAKRIADHFLTEQGFSLNHYEVRFDENNSDWENSILKTNLKINPQHAKRLENKHFRAIYYRQKPRNGSTVIEGGEIFVFVDIKTGKILTVISGK